MQPNRLAGLTIWTGNLCLSLAGKPGPSPTDRVHPPCCWGLPFPPPHIPAPCSALDTVGGWVGGWVRACGCVCLCQSNDSHHAQQLAEILCRKVQSRCAVYHTDRDCVQQPSHHRGPQHGRCRSQPSVVMRTRAKPDFGDWLVGAKYLLLVGHRLFTWELDSRREEVCCPVQVCSSVLHLMLDVVGVFHFAPRISPVWLVPSYFCLCFTCMAVQTIPQLSLERSSHTPDPFVQH